ncbi:hypothetical protein Q8349_002147 [Vibrio cholerae]|uniref:Polysaccharide polymerase n=1 Tax=Vibrio cholerae TaxID=666 RepID=D6NLX2_VIBCL|nr:polysaccharide polymerase [Vibrio cholerae]ELH8888555.1 hypothetical protein [Vibrio cholerae]
MALNFFTLMFLKFIFCFYVFAFLFNPTVFIEFNFIYILTLIAFIFGIPYFKQYKALLFDKRIFLYLSFIVYLVFYLCLLTYFGGSDSLYSAYNYTLLVSSLFCAFFIVVTYCKLYGSSLNNFISFILSFGVFQLIFVFLMVVMPEFRDFILMNIRDKELIEISDFYGSKRSFGLANGYTSTFPMLMGVFALFFMVKKKSTRSVDFKYSINLTLALMLAFSVILNARTGLLPILIFSFLSLAFFFLNKRSFFLLISMLPLVFVFLIFVSFLDLEYEPYFKSLLWAIDEVFALLEGNRIGTFHFLEKMFHLPSDTISLLFGTGNSVFGQQKNFLYSSDIGFIRDVYMFGLINSLLLICVFYNLSKPFFLYTKRVYGRFFFTSLIVSVFLFYFKGATLAASELYNFFVLMSVFSIYSCNVTKGNKWRVFN